MMGCAFIVHSWSIETNAGQFKHFSFNFNADCNDSLSISNDWHFPNKFLVCQRLVTRNTAGGVMVIVVKCRASGPGFDASFFSP